MPPPHQLSSPAKRDHPVGAGSRFPEGWRTELLPPPWFSKHAGARQGASAGRGFRLAILRGSLRRIRPSVSGRAAAEEIRSERSSVASGRPGREPGSTRRSPP